MQILDYRELAILADSGPDRKLFAHARQFHIRIAHIALDGAIAVRDCENGADRTAAFDLRGDTVGIVFEHTAHDSRHRQRAPERRGRGAGKMMNVLRALNEIRAFDQNRARLSAHQRNMVKSVV